jgi:hypothetical protein
VRRLVLLLPLLGPPAAMAQEQPELLLRLTLSPQQPVAVKQRVTVTLTALTPVRFVDPPRWPDLAITGGRAVVLPEADTVPGTERVGGASYAALQRSYALFPASPGEIVLAPVEMHLRVGGAAGQPVEASAATAPVRLAAQLPPGIEDVARLVVSPAFRLESSTEGAEGTVRVGQAVTRRLRMVAEDSTAMLLPPDPWGAPAGLRVYADPPVLQDRTERGTLHAERRESAAYVPQRPGPVELPGFAVQWFNPSRGTLQSLTVPPVRFTALPAAEAASPARRRGPALLAALAAGLLAIGALGWWLARRRGRRPPSPLAALALACRADDGQAAMTALYRWAETHSPHGEERGVAGLAERAGVPALATEAAALEARLYGGAPGPAWRGAALLAAARQAERRLRHPTRAGGTTASLPPLNPSGAASAPRLAEPRWAR